MKNKIQTQVQLPTIIFGPDEVIFNLSFLLAVVDHRSNKCAGNVLRFVGIKDRRD